MTITILGCGISGLSCGIKLQEAGFSGIRILSRTLPPHTTSDVAGGLWFPYKAEPIHRILGWSKVTFQEMMRLRGVSDAGITMTRFFQLLPHEASGDAWWNSAVEVYRPLSESDILSEFPHLPKGQFPSGFYAEVPIAEPHKHLPYLMKRFQERGGSIEVGEIERFDEIASTSRLIVNCTGLEEKNWSAMQRYFRFADRLSLPKIRAFRAPSRLNRQANIANMPPTRLPAPKT